MQSLQQLGIELGALVEEKRKAYGDSLGTSGDALRLLYPNGIPTEKFDDALLLVRIWDKMMRIATRNDAFGETPYQDIAGYGLRGMAFDQHQKENPRTCQDSVSAPDVSTSQREQPVSAENTTSAKTTTSENATSALPLGQHLKALYANTSKRIAVTVLSATESASAEVADNENNRR